MNVILLSPHFPPNHIHYAKALKRYGDRALGIGDSPEISPELRATLDDYVYIPDMTNLDAMQRAVAYLTWKHGKIARIDSQNEFWLGIEAQLREDFNIPGQRPEQTQLNRSKLGMKGIAQKAGLTVARGLEVEDLQQLKNFAKTCAYPIVLKPVVGVGASASYAVQNDEELEQLFPHLHCPYICEEYVVGRIVTFDGFVNRHGEVQFYTSHEYNQGILESVNENRSVYYYNVTDIDPTLVELGKQCVKAFDVRERFFHIEWFRTAAHHYTFLEINVRPPGLYTIDMMNFSADINLYEMWAAALNDARAFCDQKVKYSVGFAGRRVQVQHKHSVEDVLHRFHDSLVMAEPVPGAYASAMGEFFFLVRHKKTERVIEILEYILET